MRASSNGFLESYSQLNLQETGFIYGKQTKYMHDNNIQGYKWSDKPILSSFVIIKSYSSSSKINDTVNRCCEMIDFFDFFLNPSKVDLIVKY